MLLKIHLLCSRSYSSSTPKICFPPSLTLGDFFWWCHCAMSSKRLVQKCLSVLRKQACRSTQYSPFPMWTHQFFPRLCSEMTAACFFFSSSFTEHVTNWTICFYSSVDYISPENWSDRICPTPTNTTDDLWHFTNCKAMLEVIVTQMHCHTHYAHSWCHYLNASHFIHTLTWIQTGLHTHSSNRLFC